MSHSFAGLKEVLIPLRLRLFPHCWLNLIKKDLSVCNTVLDLGCGYDSPIRYCKPPFPVGVESFGPYLQETKKKGIHNQYIKADIRKLEFAPKSFDGAVAIEVLEHLTKQEGYELVKKMETLARKKVINTTPSEYLWQDGYDCNPLQEHKSGWNSVELKRLCFKVYGMSGCKRIRGYKASVKYKPALLWQGISGISQWIVYYYPKMAFQLFAIKQIGSGK